MAVPSKGHKELICGDLRADCDFRVTGETEEEVIKKCEQHACGVHGKCTPSLEIESKMRSHIKDVWV